MIIEIGTAVAGNAAAHGLVPDVNEFGFDALLPEGFHHLLQRSRRAAVYMRAAVHQ